MKTNSYSPENMKELQVIYVVFHGSPAFLDTIEISGYLINGEPISLAMENLLEEHFDFEELILGGL